MTNLGLIWGSTGSHVDYPGEEEVVPSSQLFLAIQILRLVSKGSFLDLAGLLRSARGFLSYVSVAVSPPAFMVSKVQRFGIGSRDSEISLALVVVPAYEVNGIFEVRSIGKPVASILHIFLPSRVDSLGITLGAAFSFPRNHP